MLCGGRGARGSKIKQNIFTYYLNGPKHYIKNIATEMNFFWIAKMF